jgi:hypothetical protein
MESRSPYPEWLGCEIGCFLPPNLPNMSRKLRKLSYYTETIVQRRFNLEVQQIV